MYIFVDKLGRDVNVGTDRFFFIIVVVILFLVIDVNAMAGLRAFVMIHPDIILGEVNRHILGNNCIGSKAGHNADLFNNYGGGSWNPVKQTFSEDYLNAVREAGISVLRWPGGGWHKALDWKHIIGPVVNRPDQQFGLSEFLSLCDRVGAKPVITLPSDRDPINDLVDLVEYLNSPNDHSNPNGGIDWAAVRVENGRAEPWGIEWFEYGNESYVTNMSADEYVDKYERIHEAITRVDPNVKLGAVLENKTNFENGWTYTVLNKIGKKMDFGIIHPYLPKVNERADKIYPKETIAMTAVSADADFICRLNGYNALIKKITGRDDLPLAATEYNGHFTQNKPLPFKHTLVNAIHNADFVRIMLQPEFNVSFANYWQLSNSSWGMFRGGLGTRRPLVKEANYFVYQTYNKYLGENLVRMDINSPHFEFSGALGIGARIGKPSDGPWEALNERVPSRWKRKLLTEGRQTQNDGVVTVDFSDGKDVNYYHAYKEFGVEPNTLYKISVKIRTISLEGGKIGLSVVDARGWDRTLFSASNIYLSETTPWDWVTLEYRTANDAKKIKVMARRISGSGKISGRAQFGEMRIEKKKQNLGAVESVVGIASRNAKGGELFVVLINKDLTKSVDVNIAVKVVGEYEIIGAESLTGPSPFATNRNRRHRDLVKTVPINVEQLNQSEFFVQLPPLSVTGIKLRKNSKLSLNEYQR